MSTNADKPVNPSSAGVGSQGSAQGGPSNPKAVTLRGMLDVNDRHPELYGDCLLLRDDDSMGFAFEHSLRQFIGRDVVISISLEKAEHQRERHWPTDAERKAAWPINPERTAAVQSPAPAPQTEDGRTGSPK